VAGIHLFDRQTDFQILEPGHVLFDQGDPGDEMFAVIEGTMEIWRDDQLLATAGPGDVVGELALIADNPRSARVLAVDRVRVVAVDRERFMYMVQEHPTFALQVMASMADSLLSSNERPHDRVANAEQLGDSIPPGVQNSR
jgi:CRP-like cAMP-binding protein